MLNVANRSCIRRLSLRAMRANRTRNLVAVLAIAMTALLFTSLFTIALSSTRGCSRPTSAREAVFTTAGSNT